MSQRNDNPQTQTDQRPNAPLGLTRARRFRLYRWSAVLAVIAAVTWALVYLQPHRWYTYTDVVSFEQVAHDTEVGYVLWEPAAPLDDELVGDKAIYHPGLSSDGARMVHASPGKEGTMDLFIRRWDGQAWSKPVPMRALCSNFEETSPSLSGDGRFLFFASDRPGGRGGMDIWVARWDGVEYAWPLPLTSRVNSPFDEVDPGPSPDHSTLYFASNRPRQRLEGDPSAFDAEIIETLKTDYDLYAADLAAHNPPYELAVERQLSMLYSLREGALADEAVMQKLGGTNETERAVDKALAYLKNKQSEDGRWDLSEDGGDGKHDMGATGFALLAYYGRGYAHDKPSEYQDVVRKGIDWLVEQQDKATGDLRGKNPKGDMYSHAIAALAVIEAYGITKDPLLKPRAQSAVDFIEAAQHEAGGWRYQPGQAGDLSVTGWVIMALASADMSGLRVEDSTMDRARRFLRLVSSGEHGGAFGYTGPAGNNGSSPAMNAVGFFCNQLLGQSANSLLSREASEIIEKKGFNSADLYYAYYGTLASYQHQGPVWRNWLTAMRDKLVAAQRGDGAWIATGPHGNRMGTIVSTALAALSLQAHYRYTPLYGLGYEPDPDLSHEMASRLIPIHQIPETPLYRHAAHLPGVSSAGQDTGPAVTDHGDFLYFASDRNGGMGGSDLYRARFARKVADDGNAYLVPGEPMNLGPEINTDLDETAPAVRMAGFNLLFNSSGQADDIALSSAMSKRVVRKYDRSKAPDAAWFRDNIGLILTMLAAILVLVISLRFAIRKPILLPEPAHG
ncbi:MAG: hypothetical protein AAGB26_05820 [Planctomycetota bacterium]